MKFVKSTNRARDSQTGTAEFGAPNGRLLIGALCALRLDSEVDVRDATGESAPLGVLQPRRGEIAADGLVGGEALDG